MISVKTYILRAVSFEFRTEIYHFPKNLVLVGNSLGARERRILLLEIRGVSVGARSIRLTTGLSRFQDEEDKLTCTLFRP